ncbi:periplasmic heavy metal sensor [Hyphomicrobium sp.]|uniref:periplasmic heavy metal sensor n=1 Tax=Hyphomicrobium sp. TaxID=82 RepID=UPI002D78F42E|nr:periplasmic heavy metal sensor [Hyphomicrobium sp.]HET6390816.1 periplasmic heavy metal sensor [Hyphomicrobium sp.]
MTVEVNNLAPTRSRYLYPAFIASLALNLVFVGLFAAAAWHHHQKSSATIEPGLLGFVKHLPSDRQVAVRNEITGAREAVKDLRAEVKQNWLAANALLTQEPFDKAKFAEALAKLRETENVYKTALNNAMAETAANLTPEERKILQSWREARRASLLKPQSEASANDGTKRD